MLVREGDESWKRIVPVSDDIRQAIIAKKREHIAANANGTGTAKQGDEMGALILKYIKTLLACRRNGIKRS
jgi:hypothetical protein